MTLFLDVHCGLGCEDVGRPASFYFHEHERLPVPPDQINLAAQALWTVVSFYHHETQITQVPISRFLACTPQHSVRVQCLSAQHRAGGSLNQPAPKMADRFRSRLL